jgi:hypothetical protein
MTFHKPYPISKMTLLNAAEAVFAAYLHGDLDFAKIDALAQAIKAEKEKSPVVCGWTVEDMHTAAKQINQTISPDQAEELLELVEDNFDANCGVNWQSIQSLLLDNILERDLAD